MTCAERTRTELRSALERRDGAPLTSAPLNDGQRLALVVEGCGLLSALHEAGLRLDKGWEGCRVDGRGRLCGIAARAGQEPDPAPVLASDLLLRAFGGDDGIPGRGRARRTARLLLRRWALYLPPVGAHELRREVLATPIFRRERAGCPGLVESSSPDSVAERLLAHGRVAEALQLLQGEDGRRASLLRLEALRRSGQWRAISARAGGLLRLGLTCRARVRVVATALEAAIHLRRCKSAEAWIEKARELAAEGGDRAAPLVAAWGELELGRSGRAVVSPSVDVGSRIESVLLWARIARSRGDVAGAAATLSRALRSRDRLDPWDRGRLWLELAESRSTEGDSETAERAFFWAHRHLRRVGTTAALWPAVAGLVSLRLAERRLDRLGDVIACLRREAVGRGDRRGRLEAGWLAVRLDLARGERLAARRRCRELLEADDGEGSDPLVARLRNLLAREASRARSLDLRGARADRGGHLWRALAGFLDEPAPGRPELEKLLDAVGLGDVAVSFESAGGQQMVLVEGNGGAVELRAPASHGRIVLRCTQASDFLRCLVRLIGERLDIGEHGSSLEPPPVTAWGGMVGESRCFREALGKIDRLARGQVPVLVLGETGTGKELAARRLHFRGPRSERPFLPVNCAALSRSLLLSELFGHARGAFTGADRQRTGVFETADGGTVFLDEIGDLPAAAQGALLRVLQEGEIQRLGESRARTVDVRVVAATHRDLSALVGGGSFRQDLFYRLNAATVRLPPLRDRDRDVVLLARHFLAQADRSMRLGADARRRLLAHSWPGNVRELRSVLQVAVTLAAEGSVLRACNLGLAAKREAPAGYHRALDAERRRLLTQALEASAGHRAGAARRLGITPQAVSYLVKRLGLG